MVVMVFVIGLLSFDLRTAMLLSVRLLDLLLVSFLMFRSVLPEEMADALRKLGMPYEFAFIITAAMRYVPLIGQTIRQIYDAQLSRGIDLRPRLRNAKNLLALLMPLLAQSFVLAEELAMAMESRGFGRRERTFRRRYRLTLWEYGLMLGALCTLTVFACLEKGWGLR
jgi:energy-coupling factor transport system permease protein